MWIRQLIITTFVLLFSFQVLLAESQETSKKLQESHRLAKDWFLSAIDTKGSFRYLYDPHFSLYPSGNNEIRQLMASRLLAEMAKEDATLQAKHKYNLDYLFKFIIRPKEDFHYVLFQGKSKLGANAMALRTLVASPFYREYEKIAEQLKVAVLKSINPDGSMEPFLQEPDYTYDSDYLLTFYTGEALVALLEYFEKIKDEKLLEIIKKSQEYYIKKYVIELDSNYYPAYVPWHSISLNKLYKITKDIKYAKATFTLNDKLLDLLDRTEHVGRFFNLATPQYGAPHASSDGVYTEGLVYAYELAFLVKDKERIAKYKEALELAFNHILSLQFTSENSKGFPEPERAIGAFRIYRTSPSAPFTERPGANVRIDTVQHILDAFRKYELVQKLVS